MTIFLFDHFIDGYKLMVNANRCALRKIRRPDPRPDSGARMVTSDKSI
jgi:hypothetical protein